MISFGFACKINDVYIVMSDLSCSKGVCVSGGHTVMCVCVWVCLSSLQPEGVTLVQSLGAGLQVRPQHGTDIKLCVFFSICLSEIQNHPKPNSPLTRPPENPAPVVIIFINLVHR